MKRISKLLSLFLSLFIALGFVGQRVRAEAKDLSDQEVEKRYEEQSYILSYEYRYFGTIEEKRPFIKSMIGLIEEKAANKDNFYMQTYDIFEYWYKEIKPQALEVYNNKDASEEEIDLAIYDLEMVKNQLKTKDEIEERKNQVLKDDLKNDNFSKEDLEFLEDQIKNAQADIDITRAMLSLSKGHLVDINEYKKDQNAFIDELKNKGGSLSDERKLYYHEKINQSDSFVEVEFLAKRVAFEVNTLYDNTDEESVKGIEEVLKVHRALVKTEKKLETLKYLEKTMPQSVKRYKENFDAAENSAKKSILKAKKFIVENNDYFSDDGTIPYYGIY